MSHFLNYFFCEIWSFSPKWSKPRRLAITPLKAFGLVLHSNLFCIPFCSLIIIGISWFRYYLWALNKSLFSVKVYWPLSLLIITKLLLLFFAIELATIYFHIILAKTIPSTLCLWIWSNLFCSLWQLELFLSSGTVCLSVYSVVAAIFGMNIPNILNTDHGYAFKWVCMVHNLIMEIKLNQWRT